MDEFVKAHNKIIFETTIESLKKTALARNFLQPEKKRLISL